MSPQARARTLAWLAVLTVVAVAGAGLLSTAVADTPVAAERGEAVFAANCAVCHGSEAQGSGDAPALGGVVDRLGRNGVEAVVREGRGSMPAFDEQLADDEIVDVVGYLETLPPAQTAPRRPRGPGMGEHMWWNGMMGVGWLWMLLGVFLAVGLLVLLVLAVVWLARGVGSEPHPPPAAAPHVGAAGESPRDILDRRYARGEIGRDEYLQARRDLEDPPP